MDLDRIAHQIDDAAVTATSIRRLTDDVDLGIADAYAVQRHSVGLREARGDRPVGLKLGFTSVEKQQQMGVSDVIIGVLTSRMLVPAGDHLDLGRFIHPRVEPEVAFLLADDLRGFDPTDPRADLTDHVTHVATALEVIDSRYRGFAFTLPDVVADNTSAAAFAVGAWLPLADFRSAHDLADLGVRLCVDGTPATTGRTSAILGDPLEALPAVVRMSRLHGHEVTPGSVVLAGAATAAVPLHPGATVTAEIEHLGSATLTCAP